MERLILIPTYNEKENIVKLIEAINKQKTGSDILILDDNSPDGTGKIVEKLRTENEKLRTKLHIFHRQKKEGLGKAYIAGFRWALEHGAEKIVSMDADFSHDPKYLPAMFEASKHADIVIGSRYIPGGKIVGWDARRYINSKGAMIFTRFALGLKPKDVTAGYKVYDRKVLQALNFDKIVSAGYAFQVEMIFYAQQKGFKILEIPITFIDRRAGQSKISGELIKSAKIVLQLAAKREGLRQFVKFSIVGFGNFLLDWGIYLSLTRFLAIYYLYAKIGSFIVAAASSYIFNRAWTFRSTEKKVAQQFVKFMAVATIGLGLNAGIMFLMVSRARLNDIIALVIATATVLVWNFTANKFWVFRKTKN